ncbi:L-type lectin family protein [Levilactobacillus mulengensis]|mgnify:CR=1 FL=1|uniref:lectin-like domain-containing protein n=1 Tax=Levilactobacillus mulengensis TaxID=2486025 RepID=UPI000F7A478B|nr:hypothetical protein [Levilactobacillus mulengensis]
MLLKHVLLGVILGLMGINFGWEIKARAQGRSDQDHASLEEIVKKAPQGIDISSYFEIGSIPENSASLVGTDYGKNQAVYLTNGPDQLGTIWTKGEAAMRLNEDQTASMWMFFDKGGYNMHSGDGMAFVMQNDERGLQASSTTKDLKPASGETLGVWGDDSKNVFSNSKDIAARAIQNSWALEFDTFSNKVEAPNIASNLDQGIASFFDEGGYEGKPMIGDESADAHHAIGRGYPHIASGYPGSSETYQLKQNDNRYYAVMKHEGVLYKNGKPSFLANGEWRHVTLSWKQEKKEMTYTFNDKDPKTGENTPDEQQSYTKKIDLNKIDPKGSHKVRWGFTGSTGGNWESNLVVFEKVPGLVDVNAKAVLTDTTDNNRVVKTDDSIKAGHQVKLDYDLSYASGWEPWRKVEANIDLPKNLSFTNGVITYSNGQTEDLSLNDLKGQDIKTKLAQNLYKAINENSKTPKDSQRATLSLNGQAVLSGKVAQADFTREVASVPATTSKFIGENAVTTATLNGFKVKSVDDPISLQWTGDSVTGNMMVSDGKDVTLTGKVSRLSGLDGIKLHVNLDAKIQMDEEGNFTLKIPSDQLQAKTTQLKVSASDTNGINSTNVLEYTITQRLLELSADSDLTFQHVLKGRSEKIYPKKTFNVSVIDTGGPKPGWQLTASLNSDTLMTKNNAQALDGKLTYVAPATQQGVVASGLEQWKDLSRQSIVIATSQEVKPETENKSETLIAGDCKGPRGLLLHLNSSAIPGQYSGQITWELKNAL